VSLRPVTLAWIVLAVALVVGGFMWFKNNVLVIDPGQGAPLGRTVRTDRHIATLIQTLEPYTPSLSRDHSKDTYRVSLFLVPLDGRAPALVPISGGHSANSLGLAKVLGSDGQALWFDVKGDGAVDLNTLRVLDDESHRKAPANLQGSARLPIAPRTESYLSAGFFTGPESWLGLCSPAEAERTFRPGQWVRAVVHADDAKQMRRFHRGTVGGDVSVTGSRRILSMAPAGSAEYLNAAFLRMDEKAEPLRLRDPDGALMIYTSAPGPSGTLMVARVDTSGAVAWTTDTAIDRFKLLQILPGPTSFAFVGTRVPVPGKVSEPILVIVDNSTGTASTHSLWR
jgi:hypothetical protein